MTRKPVPKTTETQVLVESRRRCCICFGLHRDTKLKRGQIAHLDRNHSNAAVDNLAFLCFDHHDEYDSKTSQRKNLSISEVKVYRKELYGALPSAFSQPVHFGSVELPHEDPYAGQYVRIGTDAQTAEINIIPLPNDIEGHARYFITGEAMYGMSREFGPNLGFVDFFTSMHEAKLLEYVHPSSGIGSPATRIEFVQDNFIDISEIGVSGMYGMGVTFEGTYQRVR